MRQGMSMVLSEMLPRELTWGFGVDCRRRGIFRLGCWCSEMPCAIGSAALVQDCM